MVPDILGRGDLTLPPIPGLLRVAAWVAIIYGGLGLLCNPFTALTNVVSYLEPTQENPMLGNITIPQSSSLINLIGDFIEFFFAASFVACGIGTLRLSPWARSGMNLTCVLAILTKLVVTIAGTLAMVPMLTQVYQQMGMDLGPGETQAAAILGILCTIPFIIAIPIFLLIAYNMKSSRDAFEGRYQEPQAYYGPQQQLPDWQQGHHQQPYYPDQPPAQPYPGQQDPAQQQGWYGQQPGYGEQQPPPQQGYYYGPPGAGEQGRQDNEGQQGGDQGRRDG